ncbi:MAG: phosphatase PAP2 family protein [Xanthomonadales bacterium]|nr:phosphatase PAP2 family protein [Xanthomonadales bacterium]
MQGGGLRLRRFIPTSTSSGDLLFSPFARAHLWWPLLGMSLIIAIWGAAGADFWLADHIYAWQGGSWSLKKAFLTEDVIHVAGRNLSAMAWLGLLISYAIARYRDGWSHYRRPLAYLLLATVTGSLLVAWIKSWSNVDCPWDLIRYGGERPYIDLFSLRPIGLSRGRCFPSGHASGGYAWLALYFFLLATRPSWRWWGLAAGLGLGLTFGISQQLRGAHFLSHDLWTATICWVASAALSLGLWPARKDVVPAPVTSPDLGRTRPLGRAI